MSNYTKDTEALAHEAIKHLPGGVDRIWEIIKERRGGRPTPPDADFDDFWTEEDRERIICEYEAATLDEEDEG